MTYTDAPAFQPQQPGQRDNAIPQFFVRAEQNNARSKKEGKACFDDREFVRILIPGDKNSIVETYVTDAHRNRWPEQYAAFKRNQEAPLDGTPITEWAAITRSQAEELAHMNIKTVEALAHLDDGHLSRAVPMGGFAIRDKARRFIEQAEGSAPAEKLAAELSERDAKIAQLEALITAQGAKIDELTAGQKVIADPVNLKGKA